jgi:hypothetical protein
VDTKLTSIVTWRVLTHPISLIVGWLGMTFVAVAAFFHAEVTTCEYARAPDTPGYRYCTFVHRGGSYLLLFLQGIVVFVTGLLAVGYRSRGVFAIGLLLAWGISAGAYVLAASTG